jgi:hypothetical protein
MTVTLEPEELEAEGSAGGHEMPGRDGGLHRFTIAVIIGAAAAAVPYLWVLTDLWNRSPSLFRTVLPNNNLSNFYDLQARAMLSGHLYVPNGSLGEEAFIHAGRQYTYFGLFPSLLRIPIFLVTHSLDGRLSALSILLAWLVTGTFASLLLWRVRLIVRGPALLGRAEATVYGVVVATILGGSVLVYLASGPWVYSEDIAWSVALMIGALFALLGVLEAPSRWRVIATGALVLGVVLTRGSTGYGCVIGACLAAAWFALGRGGKKNRRWWWPVLLAGLVPLIVGSLVSMAKFGIPYGYPLHDQVYFNTQGLSRIKGYYFGIRFLPTTLKTYLGNTGLHFSSVFPFITLPLSPARAVGSVTLFGTEEVTSVPGSMPLLFLLGCWGAVTALRRRPPRSPRLTAIPLAAAAVPCVAILCFGFLDNRFLGDFLPFFVLGSLIGAVDIWRRLEGSQRRVRYVVLAGFVVLGSYGVVANTAVASTPTGWWSGAQGLRFARFQHAVSNLTGHPLDAHVVRGSSLPASAPIDELFIMNNCQGLYLYPTTGIQNWLQLESGPPNEHTLDVTFHGQNAELDRVVPLVTVGNRFPYTLSMKPDGVGRFRLVLRGPHAESIGPTIEVEPNQAYQLTVDTSATTIAVRSEEDGFLVVDYVDLQGPIVVQTHDSQSGRPSRSVSVVDVSQQVSKNSLCRSLLSGT